MFYAGQYLHVCQVWVGQRSYQHQMDIPSNWQALAQPSGSLQSGLLSVNEGIDCTLCSLKYMYSSVDHEVDSIRQLGVGILVAKLDLREA